MFSFLAEYGSKRGLPPIKPRVIYAASGGCLASYIAMMSSFTSNVEEWVFSSDMFINHPTPFTPRLLTFSVRGFLYHRTDLTEYIKNAFVPHKLQDVEIITGYYEINECESKRSTVKIVSNFPRNQSVLATREAGFLPNVQVIHPNELPDEISAACGESGNSSVVLARSLKKKYLDDLMLLVSDALHKTTNIPYLMGPIGDSECIDYGVISPSPRLIAGASPERSVYFSPVNLERVGIISGTDMIFHQYILNDVSSLANQFKFSRSFLKTDIEKSFTEALAFIRTLSRYCLVIYSTASTSIPIESFTDRMVKENIKLCKMELRFIVLHD
jgi:hypothetical protein